MKPIERTALCVFSGTGNSLYVANELHQHIENSTVLSIPQLLPDIKTLSEYDKIGVVFPVYGMGVPAVVRSFFRGMSSLANKYIFVIATYGYMPANVLKLSQIHLRRAGLVLNYSKTVKMPGNYALVFQPPNIDTIIKRIKRAEAKTEAIAADIGAGRYNRIALHHFPSFEGVNNRMTVPNTADSKFVVDIKCTSCGICERNCPLSNIRLLEGKPTFQHKCQFCMRCFHFCPSEAINFGTLTTNKRRYKYFMKTMDFSNQK
jgi:Formate hydrogenlyase subunit 6/NADH:ubiquinone oxidoreductase 23 kD subunit (chain I)